MYIHIYIRVYIHVVCVYICIYIYREREIHIYIYREREIPGIYPANSARDLGTAASEKDATPRHPIQLSAYIIS